MICGVYKGLKGGKKPKNLIESKPNGESNFSVKKSCFLNDVWS